ncbi:hypothetical protein ACJ41O_013828 [Fusarium nematophilum]
MSRHANLQKAIDKLNIGDSQALKDAFAGDTVVEQCHLARINPSHYLSKAFKHPITLLSAMFDTGCVISGSRALDFFVPGSAKVDSDWDFYVPGYKESVTDMINVLSLCGVTWELDADTISAAFLRDGRVEVSTKVLEAMMSWIPNSGFEGAAELLGGTMCEIIQSFKSSRQTLSRARAYVFSRDSTGNMAIESISMPEDYLENEHAYETSSGDSFNMMRGFIETPQGIQPVQLIIGCHYMGIRSCLSFIKDFYASHVQCFVGGWCASHLYYYDASRKQATVWERSRSTKAIEKAIEKYQDRGYSFHPPGNTEPTIRRLTDENSMFLDYGNIYRPFVRKPNVDMLDKWLAHRRRNIDTIHWVEFGGRILAMYSPLETCSRTRPSFATSKFNLPVDCLRRLADIITLSTSETDGLRTKSFYSSVRKTISGVEWTIREAAKSGGVYCALHDASPWSWTM